MEAGESYVQSHSDSEGLSYVRPCEGEKDDDEVVEEEEGGRRRRRGKKRRKEEEGRGRRKEEEGGGGRKEEEGGRKKCGLCTGRTRPARPTQQDPVSKSAW